MRCGLETVAAPRLGNRLGCGLAFFLLAIVVAQPALAARAPVAAAELPGTKAMLSAQVAAVEREIAARMMKRAETPADRLERLETEIDLRIVARFVFNHALAAAPGSEAQLHAALRGRQCLQAIAGVEAHQARQDKFTQMQSAVAKALHQLTFEVDPVKTAKDLDEFCKKLSPLVLALGTPPEVAQRPLVFARPRPVRLPPARFAPVPVAPAAVSLPAVQPPQDLTPQQMLEEARRLNVSGVLRQQLITLAAGAIRPADPREGQALRGMLDDALDLARGLQSNTAVSMEQRVLLESQLAEALVFFLDPRTRAMGQQKMAALQQYRQFLTRVGRMGLTPEQQAQLSPALTWARENGKTGDAALAAMEGYSRARQRFDARPKLTPSTPQYKRINEDMEKLFAVNANAFQAAVMELTKTGAARMPELEAKSAELKRVIGLLERVDRLPGVLDALGAFKVKPTTQALERKMLMVAAAAGVSVDSPSRQEAAKLLDDLFALHQAATTMPPLTAGEIPAAIEHRWTGGRLPAVDTKWRDIVGELATALAAGQPLDTVKLERLPLAVSLYESLQVGAAMDVAMATGGDALSRWADWHITIADLKPLLLPYPKAVAAAFEGYVTDANGWETRWSRATRAYRPLAVYLYKLGAYSAQCDAFPAGVANVAACLMTAYEGAPYGQERQAAFAILLWNYHNQAGNSAEADAILLALSKRLSQE